MKKCNLAESYEIETCDWETLLSELTSSSHPWTPLKAALVYPVVVLLVMRFTGGPNINIHIVYNKNWNETLKKISLRPGTGQYPIVLSSVKHSHVNDHQSSWCVGSKRFTLISKARQFLWKRSNELKQLLQLNHDLKDIYSRAEDTSECQTKIRPA